MGAIFSVPLARASAIADLPGETVALVMREGEALHGPVGRDDRRRRRARRASTPRRSRSCTRAAHIPITGDSLNAAMAATVALYEFV